MQHGVSSLGILYIPSQHTNVCVSLLEVHRGRATDGRGPAVVKPKDIPEGIAAVWELGILTRQDHLRETQEIHLFVNMEPVPM